MSYVASAIIGAGALGAGASIWGAQTAAKAQTNAANSAIGALQGMFNTATSYAAPFAKSGAAMLPLLTQLLAGGPGALSALATTPGFQFTEDWGQKGAENALIGSRGLGGNVATGVSQFASGTASQTWQNVVNALLGLTGQGSTSASSLGSLATTTGGNIANMLTGIGNAQAGGAIGTANAIGGLGNSVASATLLSQLLNKGSTSGGLYNTGGGYVAGTPGVGAYGNPVYNYQPYGI